MQTFNVYGLPTQFESVSNVTATNSVELGERRIHKGEEYVYFYNAGAQSAAIGDCMVLSLNSGYSLTNSSVTNSDLPMCVVKHAAVGTGAYAWGLVRGFTKVKNGMVSTALTARDILVMGDAGGTQTLTGISTTALCQTVSLIGLPGFGQVISGCASGASGLSTAFALVRCFG